MRGSLCCEQGVAGALCLFAVVVAARDLSEVALLPALVWPAMRSSCVDVWLSCCRQRYAGRVLLPWRHLHRLMAGLSCCWVCWAMVAIGGRLRLCVGAQTPSWWGLLRWCVAHLVVGRGVVVYGPSRDGACCGGVWPPSWWGVLRWCVPPLMGERGVVVCGPPHGGAWCGVVWLPAWWGVLRWCLVALMMGCGLVVCGTPHGGACCGVVWPPSWSGVLR